MGFFNSISPKGFRGSVQNSLAERIRRSQLKPIYERPRTAEGIFLTGLSNPPGSPGGPPLPEPPPPPGQTRRRTPGREGVNLPFSLNIPS